MKALDDISLVAQVVLMQNKQAFDTLVRKYQSDVRRFFLHLTMGDHMLSDDLAQDTFIKAYTNLHSFKQLSGFKTWLFRIAYNVFYDYIRTQKNATLLDLDEADKLPFTGPQDAGNKIDLYRAMHRLRPEERICLSLFYIEDENINKIALITGMPANTVKSHLSRGKKRLAEYLKQNGYE